MFHVTLKFADAPASTFRKSFFNRSDADDFADACIAEPDVIAASVEPVSWTPRSPRVVPNTRPDVTALLATRL
jgi:hypothetical protein